MKALTPACRTVTEFPPGRFLDSALGPHPVWYYDPAWRSVEAVGNDGLGEDECTEAW